jgi:hypothetical protein
MRTGDVVDVQTVCPIYVAGMSASQAGRPVSKGTFRAMQSQIALANGGTGDTVTAKLQDSLPLADSALSNPYIAPDDGGVKLREGAATLLELDIPFTAAKNFTLYQVKVKASQVGAVVAGKTVTCEIQGDAGGDPDGSAIAIAYPVEAAGIGAAIEDLIFTFPIGAECLIGVDYHIVIGGDYALTGTEYIKIHYNTVVGTGVNQKFDLAWGALDVNKDVWFNIYELVFTDVVGASYTHAALADDWIDPADSVEQLEMDLNGVRSWFRFYYTISAGTQFINHTIGLSNPVSIPAV